MQDGGFSGPDRAFWLCTENGQHYKGLHQPTLKKVPDAPFWQRQFSKYLSSMCDSKTEQRQICHQVFVSATWIAACVCRNEIHVTERLEESLQSHNATHKWPAQLEGSRDNCQWTIFPKPVVSCLFPIFCSIYVLLLALCNAIVSRQQLLDASCLCGAC